MKNVNEMTNDQVNQRIAELRGSIATAPDGSKTYPTYTDSYELAFQLFAELSLAPKNHRKSGWLISARFEEGVARAWLMWKEDE